MGGGHINCAIIFHTSLSSQQQNEMLFLVLLAAAPTFFFCVADMYHAELPLLLIYARLY